MAAVTVILHRWIPAPSGGAL